MIKKYYKKLERFYKKWKFYRTPDNDFRINYLREKGVKIGERCLINYIEFTADPYLVQIGDDVAIARNTRFITHDGSTWLFKDRSKMEYVFGKITIGNNCFIGENCIILPNTQIGNDCVVGAGSVVRGKIPDGSVVFGNPAEVVMKSAVLGQFLIKSKYLIDESQYTYDEKRALLTELLDL